jgi:hypothetical protein
MPEAISEKAVFSSDLICTGYFKQSKKSKKMKKVIISLITFVAVAFVLEACNTRTYDDISGPKTNITYTKDIAPIMTNYCISCHSVSGEQEPYLEDYQSVKDNIDAVLSDLNNGIMPQDGPLPSSTINTIQKWKDNNMPE